jgi:hypothetical protein
VVEGGVRVGGNEVKPEFGLFYPPSPLMLWGFSDYFDGFPDVGTEVWMFIRPSVLSKLTLHLVSVRHFVPLSQHPYIDPIPLSASNLH